MIAGHKRDYSDVALLAIFYSYAAFASSWDGEEEKFNLQTMSSFELSAMASDQSQTDYVRWQSTLELANRKDASSKPLLIHLLSDDYQLVRGSAAWGLSQIGGEDAQNALLEYLLASVKSKSGPDLARATEAEKELPDKRAVDLLIKCLHVDANDRNYPIIKDYAAEALGRIGDPKSSIHLAQQLNIEIDYVNSRDYGYMEAIRTTKGPGATPLLVDYLGRLVQKMAGQDLSRFTTNIGYKYRQTEHNFRMYKLTLAALEAVTGRKSPAGSREELVKDWTEWWKEQVSRSASHGPQPARSE